MCTKTIGKEKIMPKTIYATIAWGLDHQNGLDFNYAEITRGHDHQTGL